MARPGARWQGFRPQCCHEAMCRVPQGLVVTGRCGAGVCRASRVTEGVSAAPPPLAHQEGRNARRHGGLGQVGREPGRVRYGCCQLGPGPFLRGLCPLLPTAGFLPCARAAGLVRLLSAARGLLCPADGSAGCAAQDHPRGASCSRPWRARSLRGSGGPAHVPAAPSPSLLAFLSPLSPPSPCGSVGLRCPPRTSFPGCASAEAAALSRPVGLPVQNFAGPAGAGAR